MGKVPSQGPNTNTNTIENTGRMLIRVKVGKVPRKSPNTSTNEITVRILIRVKVGKVPKQDPNTKTNTNTNENTGRI